MHVKLEVVYRKGVLRLGGRFEFSSRLAICDPFSSILANPGLDQVILDLHGVTYIDSAALGQLLVMQDKAKAAGKSIVLAGARGMALDILNIANFHRRFDFLAAAPAAPPAESAAESGPYRTATIMQRGSR